MLNYLATLPYRVDIPKPNPPDSKDVVNKGNDLSDWIAHRGGTFWTIVVILVAAFIITMALKRAFIKGIVIGAIILAIILAIMKA